MKEKQDEKQAQELQEAQEKFDNMKELLLTENALLRQLYLSYLSFLQSVSCF